LENRGHLQGLVASVVLAFLVCRGNFCILGCIVLSRKLVLWAEHGIAQKERN